MTAQTDAAMASVWEATQVPVEMMSRSVTVSGQPGVRRDPASGRVFHRPEWIEIDRNAQLEMSEVRDPHARAIIDRQMSTKPPDGMIGPVRHLVPGAQERQEFARNILWRSLRGAMRNLDRLLAEEPADAAELQQVRRLLLRASERVMR